MAATKKSDTKRQTKAGMMAGNRRKETENDEIETGKDPAATPKISKDKAEEKSPDKPLH